MFSDFIIKKVESGSIGNRFDYEIHFNVTDLFRESKKMTFEVSALEEHSVEQLKGLAIREYYKKNKLF